MCWWFDLISCALVRSPNMLRPSRIGPRGITLVHKTFGKSLSWCPVNVQPMPRSHRCSCRSCVSFLLAPSRVNHPASWRLITIHKPQVFSALKPQGLAPRLSRRYQGAFSYFTLRKWSRSGRLCSCFCPEINMEVPFCENYQPANRYEAFWKYVVYWCLVCV